MKLGAQLYTIREFMKTEEDFRESMKKVAQIGYKAVQLSSVGDIDPNAIKAICDENGLEIVVTHSKPSQLLNDTAPVIKEHDIYNCKYIGIGSMPLAYRTPEKIADFIKDFTPIVEDVCNSGKKFMYHHHSFEFHKLEDGKSIFDHLLEAFPPEKFGIILDTYWLQNAGIDIIKMTNKLKGRLECVHLKDMCMPNIDNTHTFAAIGEGNIDFLPIIENFAKNDVKYMFVEQDECPRSPFDCLESSYNYVRKLGF